MSEHFPPPPHDDDPEAEQNVSQPDPPQESLYPEPYQETAPSPPPLSPPPLSPPPLSPPPLSAFPPPIDKEPGTNFGLIMIIAGALSLITFSIILIYSLLFAPSPPPQPILIEAVGVTKSLPKDAQLPETPNRNATVFKMLREENTPSKPGAKTEQPSAGEPSKEKAKVAKPTVNLVKREPPKQDKQETTAESSSPAAGKAWYVQIAALGSQAAADRAWGELHDRFPEILYQQNYHARITTLDSGASLWRLLLGPYPKTQAETLCQALKKRAQNCLLKRLAARE